MRDVPPDTDAIFITAKADHTLEAGQGRRTPAGARLVVDLHLVHRPHAATVVRPHTEKNDR